MGQICRNCARSQRDLEREARRLAELISVPALPRMSYQDRALFPTCEAIYFAHSVDGEIIYIGETDNLRRRWKKHAELLGRTSANSIGDIAWYEFEGKLRVRRKVERMLILAIRPKLHGWIMEPTVHYPPKFTDIPFS